MSSGLNFIENAGSGSAGIVFVHGGGISGRVWRYAVEQLSEFHCLAPDLPGHGHSKDVRPFSLDRSVQGIAELIQTEILTQRARIVGISIGVPVCVSLANRYPKHVESLFLSGPTPKFSPIAMWMMNLVSRPILSLLGSRRRANMVGQMMNLSEIQLEQFQEDLSQITPDLVIEINNLVSNQEDPNPDSIPAELFVGEKELDSTKKRCLQLSKAYGNDNYAVVLSHGHAWPLEAPDLFVSAVREWANGDRPKDGFQYIPILD